MLKAGETVQILTEMLIFKLIILNRFRATEKQATKNFCYIQAM